MGRLEAPGTPPWAVVAAKAAFLSVLPSSLWRIAVGVGVPLGWTEDQLQSQDMPGTGTWYVIGLSVVSVGAAALTLGLVQTWGERLPAAVPLVGGRRLPVLAVTGLGVVGGVVVTALCVLSALNWHSVSGFAGRTWSPGGLFMIACYLPALLWGPLLLAVTWAYWRRRSALPEPPSTQPA